MIHVDVSDSETGSALGEARPWPKGIYQGDGRAMVTLCPNSLAAIACITIVVEITSFRQKVVVWKYYIFQLAAMLCDGFVRRRCRLLSW
jgi:hypothetical protein